MKRISRKKLTTICLELWKTKLEKTHNMYIKLNLLQLVYVYLLHAYRYNL